LARLWAKNTTFDSVNVGDELPILVKWETEDTIDRFRQLILPKREEPGDGAASFANTAAVSQALLSYATELLEKGFPLQSISANGSSLSLKVLSQVMPEDTISLSGHVVGKNTEGTKNAVQCMVRVESQDNELVAEVNAIIAL